jgi:excisionase family DNA binding protein
MIVSGNLPLYLTADEAAEVLRTTRKAVYAMVERKRLPGVRKIGKRLLIRSEILLQWIDQQDAPSQERSVR